MDEATRIAVIGMGAPAAIGLGVGLLTLRPGLPPGAGKLSAGDMLAWLDKPVRVGLLASLGGALAVGAGWYVSQLGVHGPSRWPPVSSEDRARLAAIVLGVLGLIGALIVRAGRGGWAGPWAALLGATGTAIVLWPRIGAGDWPIAQRAFALGGFALWAGVSAWPLGDMLARGQRVSSAVILAGLGMAVGAGLAGTGSIQLGLSGVGFGAVLVGLAVAVMIRRGAAVGGGAIALGAAILSTLVASGRFFSEMPAWVAIVLGLVPLAGWGADLLAGRRLGSAGGAAVRIGVSAAVAAGAIAPGLIALARFAMGDDSE